MKQKKHVEKEAHKCAKKLSKTKAKCVSKELIIKGLSERPAGRLAPTASLRGKMKAKGGCSNPDSTEEDEGVQTGRSDSESNPKEDSNSEAGVQSGSSDSNSDSEEKEEEVQLQAQNVEGSSTPHVTLDEVVDAHGGTPENTNVIPDAHVDIHLDDINRGQGRGNDDKPVKFTKKKDDKPVKQKRKREGKGKKSHIELGSIPGGPEDQTLLKNFREHKAYAIWKEDESNSKRLALRLHYHVLNQKKWELNKELAEVNDKVAKSGLLQLVDGCLNVVDKVLISAIVERWHRETNTFHLPFGEMTITLDDVAQILGIPVLGTPIHANSESFTVEEAADLLVSDLGVTKEDALKELEGGTINVRMSWIREKCSELIHNEGDAIEDKKRKVEYAVRGYLMHAFGCTIFPDSTGTKISVKYLKHLKDVDKIHTYSWGSAVLAFLYNQLGGASKAKSKSIGGCLTLLQVWILEHLRFCNPIVNPKYDKSQPRMYKWKERHSAGDEVCSLISMREELDDIKESQVVWNPYKSYRQCHPFPLIAWFKGWLVCHQIEEPIYPDRVSRQLGMKQRIPDLPCRASDDDRPKVDYLLHWEDHVIPKESRGKEAMDDWDCSTKYIDWYRKITHRFVQNPKKRVTDKQETCHRSRTLIEEIQFSIDICRKEPVPSELLVSLGRSYYLAERMMRLNKRIACANIVEQEHDQSKSMEGDEDGSEDHRELEKVSQATIATSLRETRQTRKKPTQMKETSKKATQPNQTRKQPARKKRGV